MKSLSIKAIFVLFLSYICGILCYTSEDCNQLDFDENDLNSLDFLEICWKNRDYDNQCPSNDCSCSVNKFHDRNSFEKFDEHYSNSTRRSLVKEKITSIIGAPRKSRLITVMIVSQGYIAFFLNWLCSLDKHGTDMKSKDLLLFIDRGTAVIFNLLNLPFKYLILEDD